MSPEIGFVTKGPTAWNVWDGQGYVPYGSEGDAREAANLLSASSANLPSLPSELGFLGTVAREIGQAGEKATKAFMDPLRFPEHAILAILQTLGAPFTAAGQKTREVIGRHFPAGQPTQTREDLAFLARELPATAVEFLSPMIPAGTARVARPLIQKHFPLRIEQVAELGEKLAGKTQEVRQQAQTTMQNLQLQRAAGEQGIQGGLIAKRINLSKEATQKAKTESDRLLALQHLREQQLQAGLEIEETRIGQRAAERVVQEIGPSVRPVEVGRKFKEELFPAKRQQVRETFNAQYNDLLERGTAIEAKTSNLEASLGSVLGESGTLLKGALSQKPEIAASRIQRGLEGISEGPGDIADAIRSSLGGRKNSLELQDEIYDRIVQRLGTTRPGSTMQVPVDVFREAVRPEEPISTAADLVQGVIRVRAGKRAALDTGNFNVARQFRKIEQGFLKDLRDVAPTIADDFAGVTASYRTEYVPLFEKRALPQKLIKAVREDPQEIVSGIIQPRLSKHRKEAIDTGFRIVETPADRRDLIGAWLRNGMEEANIGGWSPDRFVKWWDKYRDPKTNDYVLRKALGQNYNRVQEFADTLREAKVKDFEQATNETIRMLQRRTRRDIGRVEREKFIALKETEDLTTRTPDEFARPEIKELRKSFEEGETTTFKQLEQNLSNLRKQYNQDIKNLTSRELSDKWGSWVGSVRIIGGVTTALSAPIFGYSPTAGIATAATGGFILLSQKQIIRLLNHFRGAELLTRATRTLPGSVEAASVGAQINALVRKLPKSKEENEQESKAPSLPQFQPLEGFTGQ